MHWLNYFIYTPLTSSLVFIQTLMCQCMRHASIYTRYNWARFSWRMLSLSKHVKFSSHMQGLTIAQLWCFCAMLSWTWHCIDDNCLRSHGRSDGRDSKKEVFTQLYFPCYINKVNSLINSFAENNYLLVSAHILFLREVSSSVHTCLTWLHCMDEKK